MREDLGREIAGRLKNGDIIGVGTGSTVDIALVEIAKRIATEKLTFSVVTTSYDSSFRCEELGFKVLSSTYSGKLAFGFDGADAVDGRCRVIKGKGAALLKEKILARKCEYYSIIVDEAKLCDNIAKKCPVPVEVIPDGLSIVMRDLKALGATEVELRISKGGKHGAVVTEAGNIIVDATFSDISDQLEGEIKKIVGVVESGLFTKFAHEVLIATPSGVRTVKAPV